MRMTPTLSGACLPAAAPGIRSVRENAEADPFRLPRAADGSAASPCGGVHRRQRLWTRAARATGALRRLRARRRLRQAQSRVRPRLRAAPAWHRHLPPHRARDRDRVPAAPALHDTGRVDRAALHDRLLRPAGQPLQAPADGALLSRVLVLHAVRARLLAALVRAHARVALALGRYEHDLHALLAAACLGDLDVLQAVAAVGPDALAVDVDGRADD